MSAFDFDVAAGGAGQGGVRTAGRDRLPHESIGPRTRRSPLQLDRDRRGVCGYRVRPMYVRFGSKVTLLRRSDSVASGEDPELGKLAVSFHRPR